MEKFIGIRYSNFAAALTFFLFASCSNKNYIPFPEDGPGSMQPVTKPLTFSEPQPLRWKEISPDSIQLPKTVAVDIDQLPAKPFTVNDFKPFKNPIQQKKLDWDNIPDSSVNFDTLPSKPFTLKTSLLPKPVITKAGIPKLMPNSTSGILQFGEEEGLPGQIITASVTDRHGMVWLATNRGLCRYTGDLLYTYSFLNKIPQGSDYTINKLTTDHKGRIWAITNGDGIYILDTDKGLLQHDGSNLFPADIICDHEGNMWIACFTAGLYFIDTKKGTIKNIPPNREGKPNLNNNQACIKEDRMHNIWTGNKNYISIIDSSRKKIKKLTRKEGLVSGFTFSLFEDSQGNMWMGNFSGELNFISLEEKTISTLNAENGLPGVANYQYAEDREGKIWAVKNDTLYVFNKERTAVKKIVTNARMFNSYIGTILTDRHGNIWIGTVDKCAIVIDPEGPLPEHLDSKNGLSDNNIWGILEDKKQRVLIGTYNGINIYEPLKNQVKVLGKEQGLSGSIFSRLMEFNQDSIFVVTPTGFSIISTSKKIISNYSSRYLDQLYITNLAKDKQNNLWASTGSGVLQFEIYKNVYRKVDRSSGLPSNLIWTIATDYAGKIWAGSDSGVIVIDPVKNSMKFLREKEGLCNNIVQKIVPRKNGEVWVATQKGIAVVDINKNTITNLTAKEGLVPEVIFDLLEVNNTLYAGSLDGMIAITTPGSMVNKKGKWGFVNYGKRDGFPFNDYNQNAGGTTSSGQLWWGITPLLTVATQLPVRDTAAPGVNITGVNIMDQSASFFSFKEIGKQINSGDTIWDETKKKYYLKNKLPKDSGYLTSNNIYWDSTTALFKLPAGLVMPHDQNSLNFSFSNNNARSRDKITYCYILEGADKKWSDFTERPQSKNYYNLPKGNYTFRVRTRGFNGLWGSPAELSFTINPPWWLTWWACFLYAGMLGAITWSFAHYRSLRLKRENRVLEEKVMHRTAQLHQSMEDLKSTQTQLIQSEKMASLGELTAGIAHEIQNPLNFVNNFSEVNKELLAEMNEEINKGNYDEVKAIAKDVSDNEEKINHHGKRADAIVKGMLQHSRTSSGQKEPTNINALADEYLRLAYHGLRAKDKSFNATMKTDFDESIGNINIIPQDIGRVILNLITNAFYAAPLPPEGGFLDPAYKHEPTIWVSTKKIDDKVFISVRDNGPGIPQKVLDKIFQPFFTTKPTGQGTGLGLSLSYDIIKAHGGEIKVETKEGEGTAFIISLSLKDKF